MVNLRLSIYLLLLCFLFCFSAAAGSVTGDAWIIHFNLPDQDSGFGTTGDPEEWAIREALLARINALQSGDDAQLAVYSFSGTTPTAGAAGPIINAINSALDRGATVSFVVDSYVNTSVVYGYTNSLDSLASRSVNPLVLVEDDSAYGIMHHKLGLFDYGGTNKWTFITSWNFTGGASTYQWNIALEANNNELYSIYTNEMEELLAGRFHDHSSKSHAHDGMTFQLEESDELSWVRFGPYPGDWWDDNNALGDITNAIIGAEEQIVFALNKLTRFAVVDELIAAADRGVLIYGVMPRSDTDPGEDSYATYTNLIDATQYATTNRVHFLPAYATKDYSSSDAGESDLIHAKYMVIDPFGDHPMVIHGSANWTASALSSDDSNDENVNFICNAGVARFFYAHFKRITGAFMDRSDFWCEIPEEGLTAGVELWTTDTNRFIIDLADTPEDGSWTSWRTNETGRIGCQYFTNSSQNDTRIFRARRMGP